MPSPETVLLAVTGMSPAVLTETVWALAHGPDSVIPSRVIAVTTTEGRRQIEAQLFTPSSRLEGLTAWESLRRSLAQLGHDPTDRLRFGTTADDVRVITAVDPVSGRSQELTDIRSPGDNDAAADFLLEQVRAIVENPDVHLIASVAGGRKTMGALLYACLTLVGRETDRLTHVLVSEPFETFREFYFPGQPGGLVSGRDARTLDPAMATVELADVPFVPLRNLFPRHLGRKVGTFSRLVDSCREHVRQAAGENVRLTLDETRTEIEANGVRLKLSPREHLLLLFLALRAKGDEPPLVAQKDAIGALNEFRTHLLRSAAPDDFTDWRHTPSLGTPLEEGDLRKALSSLRQRLREAGPATAAVAACLPQKGRFALSVPGPLIFVRQ
ncbi:MAG: TIGR02584 family CRISPR-associated protein [Verrucomicrobiales bacterium]|nr:TIGR02584 family CRISPR-associated protein [Verrucomicrobiales bacterium]